MDELDAPAGVEVVDARRIVPDEIAVASLFRRRQTVARDFSDRFRYSLLEQTDCCWVDADIICLKQPDFDGEAMVWGRQPEAHGKALINNAVMKLPRGLPRLARDAGASRGAASTSISSWGAIGPFLLTEVAERHGVYATRRATAEFYPIGPDRFLAARCCRVYRDGVAGAVAGATFLHLWSELLRRCGYDMSRVPPRRLVFARRHSSDWDVLDRFDRVYDERGTRRPAGGSAASRLNVRLYSATETL